MRMIHWLQRLVPSNNRMTPTIQLVGAGPGDPELLTVKALNAIRNAQIVIHDRLVSDDIMALLPRRCERIYVGKSAGDHHVCQEDIETLSIAAAKTGKRVVRLKGGDPFTFGRGGEEMQAFRHAGINVQIIPGISAAAGCAAQAGIPLTDRHYADSVTLVTAQRRDNAPATNWRQLASDPGRTLVFYMGLGHAQDISDNLILHGLPGHTPVAFIENGTTSAQREVFSTLDRMGKDAKSHQLKSPCLIIVGQVTELAHKKVEIAATQKVCGPLSDGRKTPLSNLSQSRGHHEKDCSDHPDLHLGGEPFTGHRRRIHQ